MSMMTPEHRIQLEPRFVMIGDRYSEFICRKIGNGIYWHYVHDVDGWYDLRGPCFEIQHEPGLEPWREDDCCRPEGGCAVHRPWLDEA